MIQKKLKKKMVTNKIQDREKPILALEILFVNKQQVEYKCEDYDLYEIKQRDTFMILESKNPKLKSKFIPLSSIIMIQIKV